MDYLVNTKDILCIYSVVMYMCIDFKPLKIVCTFRTKICDLVKNYVHYGETYPHAKVEYGYIFVKII